MYHKEEDMGANIGLPCFFLSLFLAVLGLKCRVWLVVPAPSCLPHGATSDMSVASALPLEGLMLKLQYFGHLMGGADSSGKSLMLGKIEGRRRRGR